MEDLLYVNGFHQPITCSEKPDDKTDEEWNLLNRRVCGYIRQWIDDNVLNHVSGDTNAHKLWSKLEQMYAPKTCNGKMFYMKQLMSLRYRDGSSMSGHLNVFQGLINRLSEMGVEIDDEVQALWLLGTLPDSWEAVRTSLLNARSDGVISVELAKHSVLNEEMRRRVQGASLYPPYTLYGGASHLYTTIKVARDEDLRQQIGKDIFFDLVDHDKVFSFRIHKQTPFARFKEEVARKFGVTVHCQRFWLWAKRENRTYRPDYPLTPQEEAQPVGQLLEVLNKANNVNSSSSELKLFLEVEIGQDSWPVPPPVKTKNKILLFFKLYDPFKEELW
ncbi:hypothetical protein SSX86_030374 [Deinandra increscens subsp. villosa]|uniref:Ubiquitin carboxyl-terminal hydrolase 7 ICP0-binding domain-containing protein n=1 Tax=Deinandra increscens subsp. villosa TaxID=3103831 RepID=A0AAP0GIN6_9ASTR